MRISDWSSDVCSSDLDGSRHPSGPAAHIVRIRGRIRGHEPDRRADDRRHADRAVVVDVRPACRLSAASAAENQARARTHFNMKEKTMKHALLRSEEHTSELQSLMRISYAVFCLKKKKT